MVRYEIVKALSKEQAERIEWGLRAVHEIQGSGPLEKTLTGFCYGTGDVTVQNYWEHRPVAGTAPASVKWLAVAKPAAGEMLLVLASWSDETVKAEVRLDLTAAVFAGAGNLRVEDAETGSVLAQSALAPLTVDLPFLGQPTVAHPTSPAEPSWASAIPRVGTNTTAEINQLVLATSRNCNSLSVNPCESTRDLPAS